MQVTQLLLYSYSSKIDSFLGKREKDRKSIKTIRLLKQIEFYLQDHPTMLHQYLSGTCPGQAQSCPAQTCPGPVQDKHLTWGLVMIQSWFHRLCHKEIQKKLRLLQCHLQSQWLHRQTVQEKLRWVKTRKMSWKRRKSVSRNGLRPSTGWHRRWKWPKSRRWQVYLIRKDAKIPIGNFLNYYFSNYFSCLFTF